MTSFHLPPLLGSEAARIQRPVVQPQGTEGGKPPVHGRFEGVLADAIDHVGGLQNKVQDQVRAAATGEPVELHDVMMSMGKSEVAFNLLLEMRNKLVDAWDKLSRSVG